MQPRGWIPPLRESTRLSGCQSSFGIHVDFLRLVKGVFFLIKKPLEGMLSVYTNSETAIAGMA
jgi:hypothetical protein